MKGRLFQKKFDLIRRKFFCRNQLVDAQLSEIDLVFIVGELRIADPGYGLFGSEFFGDDASRDICGFLGGYGDKEIRILDVGVH